MGQENNVLHIEDERVKEFFNIIDTHQFDFKIGFDSCTVPALINMTSNINADSFDTCEGGRWSAYITSDMKMLPCSFDNQDITKEDINLSLVRRKMGMVFQQFNLFPHLTVLENLERA